MVCPLHPQLDSDGTITIEEQIVLVMKAKMQCELNITAQLQEGGNDAKKCLFFVFFTVTSTNITKSSLLIGMSSSIIFCVSIWKVCRKNKGLPSLYHRYLFSPMKERTGLISEFWGISTGHVHTWPLFGFVYRVGWACWIALDWAVSWEEEEETQPLWISSPVSGRDLSSDQPLSHVLPKTFKIK